MRKYSAILLLSLLPGCTKVKIESEFSKLQQKTVITTGSPVILNNELYYDIIDIPSVKDTIDHGLSKNEAVSIALQNNPELQADFQNLGIAKADLVQAGLYTNPSINSVFRIPTRDREPGTAQTNIEAVAAVRLSDLWQVPLAKHVAEDLLEIVSLRIFSTILTTVAETKIAYDACLAAELKVQNTKDLFAVTRELRDEIYYRQLYGYTSDLDKDLVDARVSALEAELKQQEANIFNAYIHLKKLLGLMPSPQPIKLVDQLYGNIVLPEFKVMEDYALENRPEIHIAFMKIRQYKDTIRLEKAKVFKVVDIGIGYKQDFDRPFAGWGPYFNLTLPIFDDNYAQVARAEFLLKQAELELIVERIRIQEELNKPYKIFSALEEEIILYKNVVLPSHQRAIEYAYKYSKTMQLSMVTALESKVKFYDANAELIDKYYHALREFTHLERAVGKNILLLNRNNDEVYIS
jgi:outer membrane protein TolC